MLLVIGGQICLQYVNWTQGCGESKDCENVPIYWKYGPAVVNATLIFIFGYIYKILSGNLVERENHRYVTKFENSMINKVYLFQFVNTYISNFVAIAYNQNF